MSVHVMINGLPGNMAHEVIEAAKKRGLSIVPYSLTGPNISETTVTVSGTVITLITPEQRESVIKDVCQQYGSFITVDYSHPSGVNSNAEFYIAHSLPFIMGTTGGDREKLVSDVDTAKLSCVIAPNMAKQIVALQAMLEQTQKDFPDLYSGYTLHVEESHQKTKADTSGTAKAIVHTFNAMGIVPFDASEINMIRDEEAQQKQMDVPAEYLTGHAFHTYRLESPDATVAFEFRHNVCGRSIYAEGTIDAVLFLAKHLEPKGQGKRFTMIDILQAGAME